MRIYSKTIENLSQTATNHVYHHLVNCTRCPAKNQKHIPFYEFTNFLVVLQTLRVLVVWCAD